MLEDLRAILRDAPFGQLTRYITGNRIFLYPEELPGFKCPHGYDKEEKSKDPVDKNNEIEGGGTNEPALEKIDTLPTSLTRSASSSTSSSSDAVADEALRLHATHTLPWTPARLEAEIALQKSHTTQTATHPHTQPIVPTKTSANTVLVDWYTTSDPSNPQNWSQAKKAWVTFLICLYTFVVYASSSIYVSSVELVRERFGVGEFKAGLGLALYVLGKCSAHLHICRGGVDKLMYADPCGCIGYGIGPLVFAPMSEGMLNDCSHKIVIEELMMKQYHSSGGIYRISRHSRSTSYSPSPRHW